MQPPSPAQMNQPERSTAAVRRRAAAVEAPSSSKFEQQLSPYGACIEEPEWAASGSRLLASGRDFCRTRRAARGVLAERLAFASTYASAPRRTTTGVVPVSAYGWVWWPSSTWRVVVDWRCNTAGNVAVGADGPPGYRIGWGVARRTGATVGRIPRPEHGELLVGRYGGWHGRTAATTATAGPHARRSTARTATTAGTTRSARVPQLHVRRRLARGGAAFTAAAAGTAAAASTAATDSRARQRGVPLRPGFPCARSTLARE